MWKKTYWPFELIIIIGVFAITLQSIIFIAPGGGNYLIIGQSINIIAYLVFLIFTIHRIKDKSKIDNHTLQYFLISKLKIRDIWIALPLFALGKLAYFFLMKIESIHVFGIHGITQISHLTTAQSYIMFFLLILFLPIGVIIEELYFRCYLFELQYLRFKNYTWIVNGFSWSIYHLFTPTNFLAFLPTCLIYSYVYQRRRNVWITFTAHLINNFIAFYPVLKTCLK